MVCCKQDLQLKYIETKSDVSPACVAADQNTSWHSMTGGQANPRAKKTPYSIKFYYFSL